MKNIIVPTDFSECAQDALEFAAFFAKKNDSKIHIIHALNMPNWNSGLADNYGMGYEGTSAGEVPEAQIYIKNARERMNKLLESSFLKGCNITSNVEVGGILNIILEEAKRNDSNIIIMGSHGNTGMEEVLIGSNAERVVQNAKVPVLTIKHKFNDFDIKKIAFASDFKSEAHKAFDYIHKIADVFNSEMHLLKINTPAHFQSSTESTDEMQRFCDQEGLDPITGDKYKIAVYNDYNEELGILNYGVENKIDIVAIATHRRKGISKFFNESISQELVNHSFRPILTINV